jgi:hypothetical protein
MSKDKGVKNIKKAPADRSKGGGKAPSAYKSESKSGNSGTFTVKSGKSGN